VINEVLSETLLSGVTALVILLVARLWPVVRAARIGRLCSIEGVFVSDLEDNSALPVLREALTQISQQGMRIRGVTTCLASKRWWHLEGEIDQSGFLRGTYRDGATSSIVGNFLLAIDESGNALSGLWTACDEVEGQVAASRYSLRRLNDLSDERLDRVHR